jgi:hypothetical protein
VAVWVVGSYVLGLSWAYLAALAAAVAAYASGALIERAWAGSGREDRGSGLAR